MSDVLVRKKRAELGALSRLASGGQGVVYAAPGVRIPYASAAVYKEYKPEACATLNVTVLAAMPAFLESLDMREGMALLSRTAWPCQLVEDLPGSVSGFVMPAIPDEFYIDMNRASGVARVPAEFQHLLNDESFLARRGIALTDRHRYQLIAETAQALTVLHGHRICVGDLSPKNLLFSLTPHPTVYFLDCDAMLLQGQSASPQLETPDWDVHAVHPGEELATPASDSYKLGLVALRLLAGDQSTRNPSRLPPQVPEPVRQLVQAAMGANPAARPRPVDWQVAMSDGAASASTTPPQHTPGQSARPNWPLVSPPTPSGYGHTAQQQPIPYAPAMPARRSAVPTPRRPSRRTALVAAGTISTILIGGAVIVGAYSVTRRIEESASSSPGTSTLPAASPSDLQPSSQTHSSANAPVGSEPAAGQQQYVKDLASIGIVPVNGDQGGLVEQGEQYCRAMAGGSTREFETNRVNAFIAGSTVDQARRVVDFTIDDLCPSAPPPSAGRDQASAEQAVKSGYIQKQAGCTPGVPADVQSITWDPPGFSLETGGSGTIHDANPQLGGQFLAMWVVGRWDVQYEFC